jgi:hypothetical protein
MPKSGSSGGSAAVSTTAPSNSRNTKTKNNNNNMQTVTGVTKTSIKAALSFVVMAGICATSLVLLLYLDSAWLSAAVYCGFLSVTILVFGIIPLMANLNSSDKDKSYSASGGNNNNDHGRHPVYLSQLRYNSLLTCVSFTPSLLETQANHKKYLPSHSSHSQSLLNS